MPESTTGFRTTLFAGIALVVVLVIAAGWQGLQRSDTGPASGSGLRYSEGETPPLPEYGPLRVSTYNIHRGKGLDGRRDISRTATLLPQDQLAGLQEVRGPRWFTEADQAEQLGTLLHTGWQFAPVQKRMFRAHIGNALLSRIPVKNWQRIPYPDSIRQGEGEERTRFRNLLQATIEVAGHDTRVIVTHLGNSSQSTAHLAYLSDVIADAPRTILLADLNRNPGNAEMDSFMTDLGLVDAIAHTLGKEDPGWRVDWILTRGFNVIAGGMAPRGISDHPYYWVELEPQ